MNSPPVGPNSRPSSVTDRGAGGILPERQASDRNDDQKHGRQGRGGIEGNGSSPAQGIVGNEAGYRSLQARHKSPIGLPSPPLKQTSRALCR